MCACETPTINGEPGFKWQPNDSPSVCPIDPPTVAIDETILYDEPGRCGGIDSHCHHYRVTCWMKTRYYLRVRNGTGDHALPLRLYGKGLKETLAALDANSLYWLLNEIYSVHRDAEKQGREFERQVWSKAAAEGRLKTRKVRGQNNVKVWIERPLAVV